MLETEHLFSEVIRVILSTLGSFAMWGGVFSSMDCLLIYYRQKDDPLNAIIAGFITGGILAIRGKII
jgi:4-amino-4-deoxy-L-arabinose transferase-like glycosyltransferase